MRRRSFYAERGAWAFVAAVLACALMSCTLHYGEQVSVEATVPELTFTDVRMTRYEAAVPTYQLSARVAEQYKNRSLYAQNAAFSTWNAARELETQGSCSLLSLDSASEIYTMFNNILIKSLPDDMELRAQNLRWNARTEQLTSGAGDAVSVRRGETSVTGTGFAASGVSRSFSFAGGVSGTVQTQEPVSGGVAQ